MRAPHPAISLLMLSLPPAYPGTAIAQPYPTKPVRVVTAEAGAGGDFVARMLSPALAERFGQQVIVDNRGGSAVIPIEIVGKAQPDGYTLLVFGSAFWLLPFLQHVGYHPVNDFAPVTLATTTPLLLVVHPSLPVKTIKELVAYARAKPGALNYASGVAGSATHLPAELFKSITGVNLVRVAYKGGGPALNALIGGEVQVMFATASGAGPQVQAGRLPARTPAAVVTQLNREIVQILNKPELKERFLRAGAEVVASTPEQLAKVMQTDRATMSKVIQEAGIRVQ
jgi:tripartite-type tricarboxylate transporter receptor subunit TctC